MVPELGMQGKSLVSKTKKRVFSVVKAVKSNAREQIGSPPAERVIPDPKQKAAAKPKHKETLQNLLERDLSTPSQR
jgi:hypothetical protein